MLLRENDVLLMIGDSITDCGRSRTMREDVAPSLGSGYVSMVAETLTRRYPEKRIEVRNRGIGGNTTRDLKARWQTDVLEERPDWLSIKIGINDVWRRFDCVSNPELAVSLEEYEANLEELVAGTLDKVKGLIVATPYFIEANREDAMRRAMDEFSDAARRVAEKYGTVFVDTQAPFDRAFAEGAHPMHFCWDRVHPNDVGHYMLAEAFLKALGCMG